MNRDDVISEIDAILGRNDFRFSERLLERLVAAGLATHDPVIGWLLECDDSVVIQEALAAGGCVNTSFTPPDIPISWIFETRQ